MTSSPTHPERRPSERTETQALSEALRLSFGILRVVMIALLVMTLIRTSVFVVSQQQRAFVLRFGRVTGIGEERIRQPGPHLAFPSPIDEIVRLPGDQVLTIESDSFHHGLDRRTTAPEAHHGHRRPYFRATITGDRNLLHSRWTLRYTVSAPEKYVFSFHPTERLLRLELDRAVIQAMAHTNVDRALRADRELRETVHRLLAQRIDELGLGIRIHQIEADRITPPPAVADTFDNVIMAEQESNELVSQARVEAARIVGEARAAAADRRAAAQATALHLSGKSAADAAAFSALQTTGIDSADNILARTMQWNRISRAFRGDDAPRIIRLRSAPERREIRLQLSGEMEGR